MDPASISTALQIAGSVAKGAWDVYQFLQAVKNIDKTAAAFVAEVETLAIACEAVSELIQNRGEQANDGLENLWKCLQGRLRACDSTVSELEVAVLYVVKGSKDRRNFFSPVLRQIYLTGKAKDVENARNLIHAHTTSLQIVLQVVEVKLASAAIDAHFPAKLETLRGTKQELEKIRSELDGQSLHHWDENEAELIQVSNDMLISGETMYNASLAGSMLGAQDQSVASFISEYGGATLEKLSSTRTWIKDQGALEKLPLSSSSTAPRLPSLFSEPLRIEHTGPNRVADMSDIDSESDDEDEIETAQAAIRSGREMFESQRYREASTRLQVATRIISKLPNKGKSLYDAAEMEYMFAICSYHVQPPAEAFEALLSVIARNVDSTSQHSDESNARILDATHLLSMTCVRVGKMRHARSYCKAARKGRRKLRDKNLVSYLESVALMARIEELEGNQDDADLLNDMIPPEQRQNLDPAIQDLSIMSASRDSVSMSPSADVTRTDSLVSGNADPLQDLNLLLQHSLDLKMSPMSESAPSTTEPLTDLLQSKAASTATSTVASPPPSEPPPSYDGYRDRDLQGIARRMGYSPPGPASKETRLQWKMFLNLVPKSDDRFTAALLENNEDLTTMFLHSKTLPRKHLMGLVAGGSPISRKDLHLAALFGDVEVVDRLLRSGANAKYKWMDDLTALHCAAMGGSREIALKLIHAGCPCDAISEKFGTAASLAALGERIDVLDLLLAHTSAQSSSLSLLCPAATLTDNVGLVSYLERAQGCANVRGVIYPSHVRKLRSLLRGGRLPDPVAEPVLNSHHPCPIERIEAPCFALAAYMGCGPALRYFSVGIQAAINAACKVESNAVGGWRPDSMDCTALTLASMSGQVGAVQELLLHKAIETSANRADSALYLAILNRHEQAAVLLLCKGAHVSERSWKLANEYSMTRLVAQMSKVRAKDGRRSSLVR